MPTHGYTELPGTTEAGQFQRWASPPIWLAWALKYLKYEG